MGYLLSITDTKLHNKSDQNRFWSLCIIIHEKLCLTFWGQFNLTLACFNDVDEQQCMRQLESFAKAHNAMPAYLDSVGMFNDTRAIFASPLMTESMYRLQRELHECMKGYDTKGWEWYCPDNWVPHCTLAMTSEDEDDVFYKASDLILHEFRKMSGMFEYVGLVKVTFPVEEIFTARLNN